MAEQDNRRLAREAFDAWNAHDPERLAKLIDEKYIGESDTLPGPISGAPGMREFMKIYITAFPDLHFDLDQMLAEGEFVATRWTATGRHGGDLLGIRPHTVEGVRMGAQSASSRTASRSTIGFTGALRISLGNLV